MTQSASEQFVGLLNRYSGAGTSAFTDIEIRRFSRFYELVTKWNPRLNLTTITGPDKFFSFHIAEPAFAVTEIVNDVRRVWDLGTGLGVPGIPVAVLRPDLEVHLVDSSRNKTIFLDEVVADLGLDNVAVHWLRLEEMAPLPHDSLLTARAVERMGEILPKLLEVGAECRQVLLFGSRSLVDSLEDMVSGDLRIKVKPLPDSENRLLICLSRST